MPLFIIETTAESPIREFWQVEAESAQQARDKFEAGQVGAFLWDEVMGDETEREVAQVHPRADLAGTISLHNAQQEAPAMLAALREARRMLVEDEGYKTYNPRIREFDAILARIDGTPTAQPAGAIGEAGERCASCGAEEGESHGAQCEARAFAAGADARRLDAGALRAVAGDDAAWLEATASRDGGEC